MGGGDESEYSDEYLNESVSRFRDLLRTCDARDPTPFGTLNGGSTSVAVACAISRVSFCLLRACRRKRSALRHCERRCRAGSAGEAQARQDADYRNGINFIERDKRRNRGSVVWDKTRFVFITFFPPQKSVPRGWRGETVIEKCF